MLDGVHFYNHTLKKAVAVFGTVFNNLKVVRKGTSQTRVPLAYGPRSKFLARIQQDHDLKDQKVAIKLPRMSFEITSIEHDSESMLNKTNVKLFSVPGTELSKKVLRQSVPYKLGMQLSILAKNQDDALQILEQILPTFVPEYTVSIQNMDGEGNSADAPITLLSTNIEDDYEGEFSSRRVLTYNLDFEMKVRFHGRVVQKPVIRTVVADLYNDEIDRDISQAIDRVKSELDPEDNDPADFDANTTFGFNE
jgi:hypothetical protein